MKFQLPEGPDIYPIALSVDYAGGALAEVAFDSAVARPVLAGGASLEPLSVRQDFPESWIWQELNKYDI